MNKILFCCYLIIFKSCCCVPPSPTDSLLDDVNSIKISLKYVTGVMDRWNSMYINQIEPRMVSSSTTIAGIDSNVHNLQERAHVWDTFQLHVSAWNDQLATSDRKLDIISKGQEKLFSLDGKINYISNLEYKLEAIFKKIEETEESLSALNKKVEHNNHGNNLFGEFATRGILSTLKVIEKKLDKIQLNGQNLIAKQTRQNGEEAKGRLMIKCNTPPVLEELLHDVSSKVDVIFDKISDREEIELDHEEEEYIDDQGVSSGDVPKDLKPDSDVKLLRKVLKRLNQPCKQTNKVLDSIYSKVKVIDNNTLFLIHNRHYKSQNNSDCIYNDKASHTDNLIQILENVVANITVSEERKEISLDSYFTEQRSHFERILDKRLISICHNQIYENNFTSPNPSFSTPSTEQKIKHVYANVSSCDELKDTSSGVYVLQDFNSTDRSGSGLFYTRFCEVRSDNTWTVIQRRDDFPTLQNFSLSWSDYKHGFGALTADFWYGNDFIHRLTQENILILRVELEDFEENTAWAEYAHFEVQSEEEHYRLLIEGYRGNASDSLSSHNYSLFSTYDRKNDDAPTCCPCAPSYGGGWWFNSCFEANLNGVYHRNPRNNEYYRGIIWEHWLGNYSLKKSTMMVRLRTEEDLEKFGLYEKEESLPETTLYPYIEDP